MTLFGATDPPPTPYELPTRHARFLAAALKKILGQPEEGTMAFVRCLPRQIVLDLCRETDAFRVPGWNIYGVVGTPDANARLITADRAVEMREDKAGRVLLLVDLATAGAGMDGIYSASREVTEQQLLDEAIRQAGKEVQRGWKTFANAAVKRARRLGERNTVSPWREFDFYTHCASDGNVGKALRRLGLWPIRTDENPEDADLETSARIVEKLFLGSGPSRTPAARVESLMLVAPQPETRTSLEAFVRDASGRPLDEVLNRLDDKPQFWLHAIEPGFASQVLQQIELITWRGKAGRVAAWSGLIHRDDELPLLLINNDAANARDATKLEVRWKTQPEDLPKGAVEYRVTVLSADEELAAATVTQTDRSPQKVRFTADDFSNLDEDSKFEARVRIAAIGAEGVEPQETEEFLLQFGQPPDKPNAGSGKKVRSLVEAAIHLPDREALNAVFARGVRNCCGEDRRGWVMFRPQAGGRSFRVFRPSLIRTLEADWIARPEEIGRWTVRVRGDGSRVGDPAFVAMDSTSCAVDIWTKLTRASRRFCEEHASGPGLVGRIATPERDVADDYLNAWTSALEQGEPRLALAHTVEVQSLSGRTIGLIVLPSHPLRVAWHTAYDRLAQYARYDLDSGTDEVIRALACLDSSQFPSLLPGLEPDRSFVFGDVLGFHAIAMVPEQDREPKAAVAVIAQCFADGEVDAAPAVGRQTATVLARELERYVQTHAVHRSLHLHALRPGDGATVARALGQFISYRVGETDDAEEIGEQTFRDMSFVLQLFPADGKGDTTGRFLAQTAERRRTGAGAIASQDQWMLESLPCPGGVTLPRLRWARREIALPEDSAHLAVAFDIFESHVACLDTQPSETRPLHGFGLIAAVDRSWKLEPIPEWHTYLPGQSDGEKHPANRILTDRILRMQRATLGAVSKNKRGAGERWPMLQTTLVADSQEALARLHRLSDWVITVDRNAGIEYFDSPRDAKSVYEAYVIDAVPERDDLGCMQLVTSTSQTAEVRDLLDRALAEMGLSSSLRNCRFLLEHLKALSGRLAIRLAGTSGRVGELIAMALVHANCLAGAPDAEDWLPLNNGFFVPLDDVPDLHPPGSKAATRTEGELEEPDNGRADLLFVTAPARGGLHLTFVEVKFRRHLRSARDPSLLADVIRQAEGSWASWTHWYFDEPRNVFRALRRSRLARALRFYADKARRHHLGADVHSRLLREIDRLLTSGEDYKLTITARTNRGYIFCPEVAGAVATELPTDIEGDCRVFLFGPASLPEMSSPINAAESDAYAPSSPAPEFSRVPTESRMTHQDRAAIDGDESGLATEDMPISGEPEAPPTDDTAEKTTVRIDLGKSAPGGLPVRWELSIRSNPHLMVVGLPGMGKTTCLISTCRQLIAAAVTPIIFSYHEDLDEKLGAEVSNLHLVDHQTLGFNPLMIENAGPSAHVDSAGMLRDIFSAIFPDFGDIQTERIRQAIKKSYTDLGWGSSGAGTKVPKFRTFYETLRDEAKPDRGLLARLTELDDYGVFTGEGAGPRLLDSAAPTIIQIHKNQNDVVQRAFASLILYSLYKDMFRRGVQEKLTHAIVFDEAHRASRLKLLPTMAKECRKYGIALILASQEARDFDPSLYSAIANYLVLRLTEQDAKTLSKNIAASDIQRQTADRLKLLDKYHALFFGEGKRKPTGVALGV